ncbi:hypothetical protein GGI42DRAFT_94428 [Trichoderma sp. SZMC 28013]
MASRSGSALIPRRPCLPLCTSRDCPHARTRGLLSRPSTWCTAILTKELEVVLPTEAPSNQLCSSHGTRRVALILLKPANAACKPLDLRCCLSRPIKLRLCRVSWTRSFTGCMNRVSHVPPHKTCILLVRQRPAWHQFPSSRDSCLAFTFISFCLFLFSSLSEAKSFGVNRVQLFKVLFLLHSTADTHVQVLYQQVSASTPCLCFSVSTSIPSAARPEYRHRHQSRGTSRHNRGLPCSQWPPFQVFPAHAAGDQGQLARGSSPIG